MSIVMRAVCLIVVFGLGCSADDTATRDSVGAKAGAPKLPEGMTHLQMYAANPRMPIDQAVFSELASDTSVLQPPTGEVITGVNLEALRTKLAKDGYAVGEGRLKATLAAFRGTAQSSVGGDDQALVVSSGQSYAYGPTVHLGVPDKIVSENDFKNNKFHWIASLENESSASYDPLYIKGSESRCLYAGESRTNGFSAYWYTPDISHGCVGTGELEEIAFDAKNRLLVYRTSAKDVGKDFTADNIPAAARFEWSATKVQMIGTKCGDQWCQIAPYATGAQPLEPTPAVPPGLNHEQKSNRQMKGRFDYQMLADRRSDGTLFPSGIFAQIRPMTKGDMKLPSNGETYSVAEVVIEYSGATLPQKYSERGFAYGTNTIAVCRDGTCQ